MLISTDFSLCVHVVVAQSEGRPHLVYEHQFSWSSISRAVWSKSALQSKHLALRELLKEFSQSQMFRLLLLSHKNRFFAVPEKLDIWQRQV